MDNDRNTQNITRHTHEIFLLTELNIPHFSARCFPTFDCQAISCTSFHGHMFQELLFSMASRVQTESRRPKIKEHIS